MADIIGGIKRALNVGGAASQAVDSAGKAVKAATGSLTVPKPAENLAQKAGREARERGQTAFDAAAQRGMGIPVKTVDNTLQITPMDKVK